MQCLESLLCILMSAFLPLASEYRHVSHQVDIVGVDNAFNEPFPGINWVDTVTIKGSKGNGDKRLWSLWWSYEGLSGPKNWGRLNKAWALCSKGQHQSPVDINPRTLVFDPNLRPLRVDAHRVDGTLVNRGHDVTFFVNQSSPRPFSFTGGPLSYSYRVHHIILHFGTMDGHGSEHTVGGKPFPLELQIYGYNSELFPDFKTAMPSAHGVAAIGLFGMLSEESNQELEVLLKAAADVPYKDDTIQLMEMAIVALLPQTHTYMTYEGSMTQPGCLETVTWIVYNKPLHIRKDQLSMLRMLHKAVSAKEEDNPTVLMENNFRPPMPSNRRTIRTNLSPDSQNVKCGTQKIAFYEVNERYLHD